MFERFATSKRRNWKRRALIIGSLALHGLVVAVLVIGSWFRVAELTPPLLAVVFVPSAPPQQQQSIEKPKSRPHPPANRAQPSTLKQPTARPEPPSDTNEPSNEPPGNDPPGVGPPGVGPPGPPSGPPCTGGNCISAPAPKPQNVGPHALDAQRIGGAIPHLPSAVAGAHRGLGDSTFTARLCVDTTGSVSSVTVLGGIPGADGTIVSALRAWRYKPQPIPVCFITQLVYNVEE